LTHGARRTGAVQVSYARRVGWNDSLERLTELHRSGQLSDEEFATAEERLSRLMTPLRVLWKLFIAVVLILWMGAAILLGGPRIPFHGLRDSHATAMLAAGVHPKVA
jgi:integrase